MNSRERFVRADKHLTMILHPARRKNTTLGELADAFDEYFASFKEFETSNPSHARELKPAVLAIRKLYRGLFCFRHCI